MDLWYLIQTKTIKEDGAENYPGGKAEKVPASFLLRFEPREK